MASSHNAPLCSFRQQASVSQSVRQEVWPATQLRKSLVWHFYMWRAALCNEKTWQQQWWFTIHVNWQMNSSSAWRVSGFWRLCCLRICKHFKLFSSFTELAAKCCLVALKYLVGGCRHNMSFKITSLFCRYVTPGYPFIGVKRFAVKR